ncbi:tetratricopeptide repeat protein [Sandaracinus amylolyticus]|uniref:Tetratricopeptide repeat protein n=1 Tax=Sandaracinus amylolyticus TaxID=927083 RepID=A0A0F6W6F4_9BACT|nr:hypothetical protein [Sandaracinus amylolyticus]AKF08592.1 hypothetical protein DB32_005741 [Sandaracinus amylolyticus]
MHRRLRRGDSSGSRSGQRPLHERARGARFLLATFACLLLSVLASTPCVTHAQAPTAPSTTREPTAEERQAAADAFDRGTRAYLARDYPRAAQWFETAYRMAPASAALVQAVRSHERAGNTVRAATLALRLRAMHAGDRDADRQSEQTLRLASQLVRVDVVCDQPCTVELDGTLMEHPSFFVAPSTDHVVRASFSTGTAEQDVAAGEAGATRELRFEAPPAPPEPVAVATPEPTPAEPTEATEPTEPVRPVESGGGLSPAFAVTGIALTAISGGVLTWSGIDTLDGVDAYETSPTPEGLSDGQARETRTNVLIGVTAGLAAVTVVLMIFTDWDGEPSSDEASVSAALVPIEGGAYGLVGGTF